MTIKTFHDGPRLVVVFEGLEGNMEGAVKGFLSGLAAGDEGDVDDFPDIDAEPVPEPGEEAPKEPFNPFKGTTYDGLSPEEITGKGLSGVKALTKCLNDGRIGRTLMNEIEDAVKAFEKKFDRADPESYPEKLSESQRDAFIDAFLPVMPEEARELAVSGSGEEAEKEAVRLTLISFKK